ncbi:unnamed protein product [Litomosoides sigmodontis]|uniref:Uncharacterized protein n=1 Tax=Litomosoides sigmodontis TaxID=42156 RepID=A0A3P6UWH0_LITSI|nr:unnamed protein product [Litomosoides sigmodontis]
MYCNKFFLSNFPTVAFMMRIKSVVFIALHHCNLILSLDEPFLIVMNDSVAKCIYLLLILTINEVTCYDTSIPDFNMLEDDMLQEKRENLHRFKRTSHYRGYGESHFYGIQSKINNQFAEFVMQAATFAANVQRNRAFYFNIAKTCKLLRRHVVALHFIIYTMAVVIPSIFGLLLAACVWRSLVRQIDGIVKAPPDGVELPQLVNKPPGFYVPLHRRPIIYLQLTKEKLFGKRGVYRENILQRRKKIAPKQ